MMVLEHEWVEIDLCPECRGIWLDAGELELLLGDRAAAADYLTGGKSINAGEKPRPCPICRGKMHKETTQGPEPITYDVCNRGDGLWFDRGELQAILEHGAAAGALQPRVAQWLKDLFGTQDSQADTP